MKPMLMDTFSGRLRFEGLLVTRTGLHIGAGGSGDLLGTDAPVIRDASGAPFIPGASIKGVIRSAGEALFRGGRATVPGRNLWACDQLGGVGQGCIDHDTVSTIRDEFGDDRSQIARKIWEESCTICRLFGSPALASRVRIPDLPLAGDRPVLEIRNGVGINRDKELAASSVLYEFEVVPPQTAFQLRVVVDNPTDPEAGLLLYLFEELNLGNLALGGKVSRGLGQVQIEWKQIIKMDLNRENPFASMLSRRNLLEEPEVKTPEQETHIEKLPASGDRETWKLLTDILRQLPAVNKGALSIKAGEKQLNKANLNERLALGLQGKKVRKTWDRILDALTECGFLIREGDGWIVRQKKSTAEIMNEEAGLRRPPALQSVVDQYVGALGRLWEEVD